MARDGDTEIGLEDRGWLEQTPQTLPVITENADRRGGGAGGKRDEQLVRPTSGCCRCSLNWSAIGVTGDGTGRRECWTSTSNG